ncbi:C-type lectin 1-like [Ptychodera flava]|uniref:C-type lectin 1-like n=1 Tax=Ptychodera flava TaxID=63121 RepID=UPI00396A7F02
MTAQFFVVKSKMASSDSSFHVLLTLLCLSVRFAVGATSVNYTIQAAPETSMCQYTFNVPDSGQGGCATAASSADTLEELESLREENSKQNNRLEQLEERLVRAEAALLNQSFRISDLLTNVVSQLQATEKTCPDPWVTYGESCYWFAKKGQSTSWHNARLFCQVMSEGADLVVVNDKDEMAMIEAYVDVLDATNSWWLGCTNNPNGKWTCIDGNELSFSNWSDGHPSRRPNRCIHMWRLNNQSWNDAHCNQDWAFICEKKLAVE